MMRYLRTLKSWDAAATLLVAAIAVPYVGYLVRGSMPFIQDARGMAGTGLVLSALAWLAFSLERRPTRYEWALAGTSLVMGVVALALAETFAAEVLLAIFMGTILVVWAEALLRDAGVIHVSSRHLGV